jgi:hypothetical protein
MAMARAKIFVREDTKKRYRYAVVAVQGEDIHFYKDLLSKEELDAIAGKMDAELVFLKSEEVVPIDEENLDIEKGEEDYEEVE